MEEIQILKFSRKSFFVLIILVFSGLAIQPVSSSADMSNSVTNTLTSENYLIDSQIVGANPVINEISEVRTSNSMIPSESISLESRYKTQYEAGSQMGTTSHGSITTTDLPEYLYTWSDFSSTYSNVMKSPYLRVYQDALVKVNELNQIETIVKVNSFGLTSEMTQLFNSYQVTVLDEYPILAVYKVSVDSRLLDQFIDAANALTGISYIQPSYYYSASFIPNDPQYPNQYGPQIIGMEYAWDIQQGNNSVIVAIIDTGIDYTHPDLGNYLPLGYDWVNDDDDPMDDHGHGTHVAGTVAATIDNGIGVAGIASVSFFAEKFLDAGGYGSDIDGANAIIHAVDVGADILSNSWGGYGESAVLEDAVNYAVSHGVLFVAAAGNGATSLPHYPAAYPAAISVTATDSSDNFAGFSNYGDWVDIAAPGVNILSTVPWGYDYFSGTSMATPHVSGLLALLISQFPDLNPDQIENLLYSTAVDLGPAGFDDHFGWGRIDASVAIEGLQEFNARALISAPSIVPYDQTSFISAGVSNMGYADLFDVSLELSMDSVPIYSEVLPYLTSGESYLIDYQFDPPGIGYYNFSVTVDPVPGETVLHDNDIFKVVEASTPVISPEVGDVLAYGQVGGEFPYLLKWVITDTSDPTAFLMDLWFFDEIYQEEWWVDTFALNPYTREYSSIYYQESGYLFAYWVQTDLQIGQTFDLFQMGGQDGYVVNETVIDYYGTQIPVWVVDDGFEYALFSQTDGVLVALRDYGFNPIIYDLIYTNALFEAENLTNLRITFSGSVFLAEGVSSDIVLMVQNTGVTFQDFLGDLWINDEFIDNITGYLDFGEYIYVTRQYTAPSLGEYYLFAQVYPALDELYYNDNFDDAFATVVDLQNYGLTYPGYSWYDAQLNGFNLGMYGDDTSVGVGLPFPFEFYGTTFYDLYISSNGWLSFGESDLWQYWFPGFPSQDHPYAVALFWDDLIAEGNVYAWATSDFMVIEYYNMNYLWGELAGTFEVVFFSSGEILFQYQYVNYENNPGKGLNYGLNNNYYSILPNNLGGQSNFAALFSLGGVSEGPDVTVGLNLPDVLEPGVPAWVEIFAQNIGSTDAEFIDLSLRINGELIGSVFDTVLNPGEVMTFSYLWIPDYEGYFTFELYASTAPGESNTQNNHLVTSVLVGGYHDLAVYLTIEGYNGNFYITAEVNNYGQTAEYNVELYLYINGELVSAGMVNELGTYEFMHLNYVLPFPSEPVEVEAFTPIRPNEDNIDNNLVIQYIDPTQTEGTVVFQVMDASSGEPLPGVYVFLGGQNTYYYGFTNQSGGLTLQVQADFYYVWVQQYEYIPFESYTSVSPGETVFVTVFLEPITPDMTAFLDIYVWDYDVGFPLEGAQINITGPDFNDQGFTNQDGIYSTVVPLGELYVEITLDGYYPWTGFIYLDIPDGYFGYGFTLLSENSPPQELYILSPSNGSVVDGGLVEVYYDATNVWDIEHIDVYVNGEFISTVFLSPTFNLFVPVFEVGMNTITLIAYYWTGAVASADVNIQSVNLVPYMDIEVGDYYNFLFNVNVAVPFQVEMDFTVVSWASDTEVLLDMIYYYYENGELIYQDNYYLVVNVINGYISETDMWWGGQHFYPFSGLVDPSNAQFGDRFPFFAWWDVMSVTGSDSWNGQDAWTISNAWGDTYGAVLKENGLFLWYNFLDLEMGEVVATSLIPGVLTPPAVSDAPDMVIELGSAGNTITWTVTGDAPDNYSILLNGYEIESGDWTSGQEISINIDGLPTGYYEFQIAVQDTEGNAAWDFVYVIVEDTTPPEAFTDDYVSYNQGETGNVISVTAYDYEPLNYTILREWDLVAEGVWTNEAPIEINIDGLAPGAYEYLIFITDMSGNTVELSVTVEVLDTAPPSVRSLPDFSYEFGSEDNYITWTATGDPEGTYEIHMDDVMIETGTWTTGIAVEINIDGLETGRYNFTAVFTDLNGNSKDNTVLVYVIPPEDDIPRGLRKLPGFELWLVILGFVGAIPVIRKRRALN